IRQLRISGDIIIGGVFPVHAKPDSPDQICGPIAETRGIHRVEAMLYALDIINSRKDFLRGYKLGAMILDSCSTPAYALNQSLDFVRDMIGSSDQHEYQCPDGSLPIIKHITRKNVAAVVGGSYSSVTVQVANLLRLFKIAQVSPASTNADLSDKNRFEYFARTVPSDNYQAKAMVDIALHFNWSYLSLVYSADEYGELGAEAFKKEARKKNICIATEERISMKKEALTDSIDNLVKKLQPDKTVGARVVVLFVGTEYVPELMFQTSVRMNLNHRNKEKKIIWLASEGWDRNNDAYTIKKRKYAADGAIVLMLESKKVPSFEEYFLSLHPNDENFKRNSWLKELWNQKFFCEFDLPIDSKKNRCENYKQSRENFNADDKVEFVIDAVFAIAHGLKAMKEAACPNDSIATSWISRHSKMPEVCPSLKKIDGEEFYKKYFWLLCSKYFFHLLITQKFRRKKIYHNFINRIRLNLSFFSDLVGKKFHFSAEGDGPAHYTILNYQPRDLNKKRNKYEKETRTSDYVVVGRWSEDQLQLNDKKMFWGSNNIPLSVCSLPCPVGYRKQLIKDEICCWACGKCEEYEYLINETTCVDCGEGWWPTPNRKDCYDIAVINLQYMQWSSWYSIVPSLFAIIGICSTIAVIIIYLRYYETPVVKASGRELSFILLIAMILCYLMTFVLLARPSTVVCAVKRTGIGFAFSCLYAGMLIKTNRISRIFSHRSIRRPLFISPISQVMLTLSLVGFQLLGSLIWLFLVPPGIRHDYPSRDQVVLTCNVPEHHFLYSLAYNAALIVLCTIYAVKTRKVPENFNETKFIGFSMYTTCVIWLSWIFFFFGTGNKFQIQTTSLCISISMSANVALICIFSPKIWIILFEKHKNVRKQGGEQLFSKRGYSTTGNDYVAVSQHMALLTDSKRHASHQSTSSSGNDIFL
ncbi:unnamed protein product, partial [Dracunculus medinensis]|uniref:G_PROTEIN_RECEP_F3_4 domain-containing protein n=1 Tax=Dracunculus medinensis TaxID=318479 RepID=A0A158Q6E9_DRAME